MQRIANPCTPVRFRLRPPSKKPRRSKIYGAFFMSLRKFVQLFVPGRVPELSSLRWRLRNSAHWQQLTDALRTKHHISSRIPDSIFPWGEFIGYVCVRCCSAEGNVLAREFRSLCPPGASLSPGPSPGGREGIRTDIDLLPSLKMPALAGGLSSAGSKWSSVRSTGHGHGWICRGHRSPTACNRRRGWRYRLRRSS
ncbi:hypothetical protein D9M71_278420 [compost metagenome]